MSNVSFRRGGLFDPMMIDSGQTLSNNAGMFANSLGKSTFDVESPDAWKAQAAKLQSLGDSQGAIQALAMSQTLQQQAQARRDQLQPVQSTAQSRASTFLTGARSEAKEKADIEKLATMAERRFGSETAELVRMLPKDQAIQLIRSSSQGPKKSPKLIKEVGEDGNTYNVIVDQNNPEDKQVLGVAEMAEKPEEKEQSNAYETSMRNNVKELLMDRDGLEAYSGASGWLPTVRPSQKSYEQKLMQVLSELTLENTDKLTGQMSDKDIELLTNAASAIIEGGATEDNFKELMKIYVELGGDPADIEAAQDETKDGGVVDFSDL